MRVQLVPGHDPGPWTGAGSNTWLIHGAVPTLIDAGSGESPHVDELAAALADSGAPLAQVLVTHGHIDHAGGVTAIAQQWPEAVFRKYAWPDRDARYRVAWHPLADDEILRAGDGELCVLHTPGHSPDHVCFYEPRSATLFAGDLVMNGGTTVIPASQGGNLSQYLNSLRRLLELAPRRILAGHGPPIEAPASLLRGYVAHRLQRERQILEALAGGARTIGELVRVMYPDVQPGLVSAAGENVLAHLLKLEDEDLVVRDPGERDAADTRWRVADGRASDTSSDAHP